MTNESWYSIKQRNQTKPHTHQYIYIYTNFRHEQDMTQGELFKRSLKGLNLKFSFSKTSFHSPWLVAMLMLKTLVCPTIYP